MASRPRPVRRRSPGRRGVAASARRARRATQILQDTYGSPRLGNKQDPLDELVFILLSQMTTAPSFGRVFDRLKAVAPTWAGVEEMSLPRLRRLIEDAGLSRQRAVRLKGILRRLRDDFGVLSLEPLASWSDARATAYMTTLPGVGVKTAKCVLMYAFGREVLPVDTHVRRVALRLELIQESDSDVHAALERVVAPADRYAFHVNAVAHGRAVCLARRPRCGRCSVNRLCPSVLQSPIAK